LVYRGERVTRVYAPRRGVKDDDFKRKKREHGTDRSDRFALFSSSQRPTTGRALTLPSPFEPLKDGFATEI